MKRTIICLTLILLTALAFEWSRWILTPYFPNTRIAKAMFKEMSGLDTAEVSEIYFYDASGMGPDWHLRFTYQNDEWLNHFIRQVSRPS